nr:hypothetical protein [Tanacetum cinerariifolium]
MFTSDDDEVNNDGIWEKPNENRVNVICDENQINDDNIVRRFFDTPDDAYTFYNQYAFVHGFGIRIHWKYKNRMTNKVYRELYVCNKQGFKKQKGDNSSEVSKKCRRDVRTSCEAKLWISNTKDGKWCIDIFKDTHNHDLTTTPTKVMKHRSHNKFHRSMACKSLMVELGKSGLRPCQVRKAVNAMKSPNEPTITSKQCVDILVEERKQYKARWTLDCRYKEGNASIGIEETTPENEVSALALWYVQANLTKAIEQARDAPSEIKRLNSFLMELLEDQIIRKKPTEIENAYKDAHVGISQVDMTPQISVRDPVVLTILKGRPRNATRVKPPIEIK